MKQVVLNLLSNAVKFTPRDGSVRFLAAASVTGISIEILDTGIGIAEENVSKALERFGKVDGRLAREYEGTGLGLPLAKRLTELNGGTLSLSSPYSGGTTVAVTRPAWRIVPRKDAVAA